MTGFKLTPQLLVALLVIIVVAGLGFANRIDGPTTLAAVLSIAGGFGLGTYHEANGGPPGGA